MRGREEGEGERREGHHFHLCVIQTKNLLRVLVFPEVAVSAPKDRTHIGSVRCITVI